MLTTILISLFIPLAGTMLGATVVFFMRNAIREPLQKFLLGFASGVMVAAAFWSLLLPAIEMYAVRGKWTVLVLAFGLLAGFAFLLLIDMVMPHLHVLSGSVEGPRSRLSRTTKMALAVTIHNLPEGMSVGVVLAAAMQEGSMVSASAAMAVTIGIALQNIPEGAIISMPLRATGISRWKAFGVGALSGVVEPVGTVLVVLLSAVVAPILPCLLAFAAGSMLYVVVEELIPSTAAGNHSNMGTLGFALGFALMMIMDVMLG